jgi:hypothetical protein
MIPDGKVWRKAILAAVVFLAGLLSHLWWGYEYTGPGMNQWDLVVVVTVASVLFAFLFLVSSAGAGYILQHRGRAT